MDRIWPCYATGWPSYAPLWELRADLFAKRPKSLKNVSFLRFFHQGAQLAANHEKQDFTFFAFLPPYMGVSSSLVPRKR